jgi:hypothetical protein
VAGSHTGEFLAELLTPAKVATRPRRPRTRVAAAR